MSCYHFLRPALYLLPAETTHRAAILALKLRLAPKSKARIPPALTTKVFGLSFKSPVGLAAGFDKNAEVVRELFAQGFGFVEAGTATPLPQAGNDAPRVFRLTTDEAVINRMGMPNLGKDVFARNLASACGVGIVGANIGKNKDGNALADYVTMLETVAHHASYVTVNISSPNTAGLRDLQQKAALDELLRALIEARARVMRGRHLPLLVKIAPDITEAEQEAIAEVVMAHRVDGLIVSNTTTARPESLKSGAKGETGGLSGRPLFTLSTEVLRSMYRLTKGTVPLVGVGGISSGADAYTKIRAGASLVQLYTAFVYHEFGLVDRIHAELAALLARDGFTSVSEAVGKDA